MVSPINVDIQDYRWSTYSEQSRLLLSILFWAQLIAVGEERDFTVERMLKLNGIEFKDSAAVDWVNMTFDRMMKADGWVAQRMDTETAMKLGRARRRYWRLTLKGMQEEGKRRWKA